MIREFENLKAADRKRSSALALLLGWVFLCAVGVLLMMGSAHAQYLNVGQYEGPTVGDKLTKAQKACNAAYSACVLEIRPELSALPVGNLPTKCATCTWFDYTGKFGGYSAMLPGLTLGPACAPNEFGNTCASYTPKWLLQGRETGTAWRLYRNFYSHYVAASGGQNTGAKWDYDAIQATTMKYTEGQSNGIFAAATGFGNGDNIGAMMGANCYGGPNADGDEGCEGIRSYATRMKDVFSAIVASVNGDVITYSSATNDATQGQGRPLIITTPAKVYSTGTIVGSAYTNGQMPTGCVIEGSGTSWATQFGAGAHNDLFIAFDSRAWNGGANKYVVPIANVIDDTHVRLNFRLIEMSESGCPIAAADTYKIYYGGKLLAAPGLGQPLIVDAGSGAHFAMSDTIESPLHYSMPLWGMYSVVNDNGDSNVGGALYTGRNVGTTQLPGMSFSGPISLGLRIDAITLSAGKNYSAGQFFGPIVGGWDYHTAQGGLLYETTIYDASNSYFYRNFNRDLGQWEISCGGGPSCANGVGFGVMGNVMAGNYPNILPGVRLGSYLNSAASNGLLVLNGTAPDASHNLASFEVGGVPRLRVNNAQIMVNNGSDLDVYSDNQATRVAQIQGSTGNIFSPKQCYNSTYTVCDYSGAGAPTGACTTGSTYRRTDGTAGATFYVCEVGAWAAK